MKRITHIVVHYSATYPEQDLDRDDIDRMHKARGWRGIGYHWFIKRDGTLQEGRPENEIGAHVAGQNTGKIGVCWAGGVDKKTGPNVGVNNMTPAQEKTLVAHIKTLLKRYPGARVVGHRDLAATECPGFDVPAWWASKGGDELRSSVVQSTTVQASAIQVATAGGGALAALGALDGTAQVVALVFVGVVAVAALWIMRERIKKWNDGDI